MIIKVEQTKSNLKNKFEIKVNNKLKYLAGMPWMDISAPLNIDNVRSCIITKTDESICYATSYNIIENISNTAVPMKWAFTGEQKSSIFNVIDNKNNTCGKFYKLTNGVLDTKYIIEYENYILKSYDISVGRTRNIPIYDGDNQIAEIIKPLNVSNNQDNYYVLITSDDNLNDVYSVYKTSYETKEDAIKMYTANIDSPFNKSYIADESNFSIDKISELKIKDDTLIKVENNELVEYFEGKDEIINELKNISE